MMKIIFALFTSSFIYLPSSIHAAATAVTGRVIDGDTFAARIYLDGATVRARIRLINVDAPDLRGACPWETKLAKLSRDRLSQLIPDGTTVRLENLKDDKYLGRVNANVILPDGRDVGDVLVEESLAAYYNGRGPKPQWCH